MNTDVMAPVSGDRRLKSVRVKAPAWSPTMGLVIVTLLLVAFFSVAADYFLTTNNILNISRSIAINGIVAMGVTVLLISGALDLSIASVMSFTGVVAAQALSSGWSVPSAIAVALVVGMIAGLLNGLLVTKIGLNSIIVTLGTMFVWQGASSILAGGKESLITDSNFLYLGGGRPLGIPMPFVLLVGVLIIAHIVLRHTRVGTHVYAVGGDDLASRRMGLKVDRVMLFAFVASGIAAGVGGILLASSIGVVSPFAAQGQELQIISSVILGGAALHGGRGTPAGTFVAIILLGVLFNGLNLMNVSSSWQYLAQGAVLIAAVTADSLRQRKETR